MQANRRKLPAIAVVALAVLGFFVWRHVIKTDDGRLTATGMVEVTQAALTPKIGGYLVRQDFTEGAQVKAGDIVAGIEKTDYELAYRQAAAAHASAEAKLDDLLAGPRGEEIAAWRAALDAAQVARGKAEDDLARFTELHNAGAVSTQQLEGYKVAASNAQGAHRQAEAAWRLALEGSRQDEVRAQRYAVEQLKYAAQAAKSNLEHTDLRAPINGRILSKNYEIGEFVQPGATLATIGNLEDCWVKIYIPSTYLGRVRFGQAAEVRVDSYPGRVFPGRVREIATQAEFTPRQTITKEERANLVFAVKVALDNQEGVFKPGMPAEVVLP